MSSNAQPLVRKPAMRPHEIDAMQTNANAAKKAANKRAALHAFQNSTPQNLKGAMGALKELNYVGGRRTKRKTHRKRKTLRNRKQ